VGILDSPTLYFGNLLAVSTGFPQRELAERMNGRQARVRERQATLVPGKKEDLPQRQVLKVRIAFSELETHGELQLAR
jgi:hypothetical protein